MQKLTAREKKAEKKVEEKPVVKEQVKVVEEKVEVVAEEPGAHTVVMWRLKKG